MRSKKVSTSRMRNRSPYAYLEKLEKRDMTPHELLVETKTKVSEISIFLDALDCLYKLGKVEIPEGTEVLRYVKKSDM